MARIVRASDNFVGLGVLGAPWAQLNGSLSNVTRDAERIKASHSAQAVARHTSGATSNDQYSVLQLAGTIPANDGSRIGVVVRAGAETGLSRDFYGYEVQFTTVATTNLFKVVNATRTTLASGPLDWVIGDTIELEVEGTTLRGYRNGGLLVTVEDTSFAAGLPGIVAEVAATTIRGDNWSGGDVTAGSPPPAFDFAQTTPRLISGAVTIAGNIGHTGKAWRIPTNAPEATSVHVVVFNGTRPNYTVLAQANATVSGGFVKIPATGTIGAKAFAFVHDFTDNLNALSINGGGSVALIVLD